MNSKILCHVKTLHIGRIAPIDAAGLLSSGIRKAPVNHPVFLGVLGLEGDQHAHPKVHGGTEKALHHYPLDHYAYWRERYPQSVPLRNPGAFGENLSTEGLTEKNLCIGDILQIGEAVVQISQGRQPCFILNAYMGIEGFSRKLQETRFTGWYYRVLEEGAIAPGDAVTLKERPCPKWSIDSVQYILYENKLDKKALKCLSELPFLSESWKNLFSKRLAIGEVEDWNARLEGTSKK